MGKPGPKQVPVTARIQKSTKGGIVQPSLPGMGSIAKMKVSSPAKQGGRSRGGYNTKDVYKSTEAPKPRSGRAQTRARNKATNSKSLDSFKSNGLNGAQIAKGAAGVGAKLATGNSGSSKKVVSSTNAGNAKSARGGFFGTDDYKKSVSAGNKEANSDNARRDFTANLKNQSKPKAKAIKAIKVKSVKSVAKPKAKIETKLAAAPAKPTAKPTKKQVRKAKSIERKTERAAKARRKGIQALESGNLAKAKRLKRRETRINKRIEKKKSRQASKAIEPK